MAHGSDLWTEEVMETLEGQAIAVQDLSMEPQALFGPTFCDLLAQEATRGSWHRY